MAPQQTASDRLDEAGVIYQTHLDTVSDALLKGDTETCMAHFALPLLVRTTESETLFETREDLLNDTKQHAASLQGYGVTEYIRLVKRARLISDTVIEGWHETHILRHAIMMIPSYLSHMFLRLEDGVWKVAEAEHALENERFPMHAVTPVARGFGHMWDNKITDARAQHPHAEPLYQAFLNVLDAAQNRLDYDAWAAMFTYPTSAHYDAADIEFAGPAMMRPFFDATSEPLAEPGTSMKRVTTRAEFISADRVCGYHETTITRDGEVILGPVKSRMILNLVEGQWKCSSVTNSLSNKDVPASSKEIGVTGNIPTMREIEERMRK